MTNLHQQNSNEAAKRQAAWLKQRSERTQPDSPAITIDDIIIKFYANIRKGDILFKEGSLERINFLNDMEEAKQAIQEYYTNKFLEVLPSPQTAENRLIRDSNGKLTPAAYAINGYNKAIDDTIMAIKDLNKE